MRIIGLTGGIASGKSTVSKELALLGATIIDADKIAWRLSEPQGSIWGAYVDRYGAAVLNADSSLNRQAIADRVFTDKAEQAWMNEMARPLIRAEIERELSALKEQESRTGSEFTVILDIPLLFEAGWQDMAEETWLVCTSLENQIARLKERNNIDREEALRRINAQMPVEKKRELADIIIDNDGTPEELQQKICIQFNKNR